MNPKSLGTSLDIMFVSISHSYEDLDLVMDITDNDDTDTDIDENTTDLDHVEVDLPVVSSSRWNESVSIFLLLRRVHWCYLSAWHSRLKRNTI